MRVVRDRLWGVLHPSQYAQEYRQENDKQTAIALTEALQVALLGGLETLKTND
jgi:hypothetical protein